MLDKHGLGDLVTLSDIDRIFRTYEKEFLRYIDDPLWPAFKFPLTVNERTRLRNKLKQHIIRLEIEALIRKISIKVKYGGASKELKDTIVQEISLAAQQLLPQTAFLRTPLYPGVICLHRGRYGFSVVIKWPLYNEGDRPREKFKAMRYFHMGHRLEDIVKRERELAVASD